MPVAVLVAALALVALSVVAGHDTTVLVAPPESVAEQFVRKLAGGRYDVAVEHLEHDTPALRERVRTTSGALRARAGAISQIEGQPGAIDGDEATATAVITTERAGKIMMAFALVRRAGAWRIETF
jgi:hypothetical protein